jgi:HEAT repeat protein
MSFDNSTKSEDFKEAWSKAVHASHSGSLEDVVPFLDSPWPAVRATVARALGKRAEREAVPALIDRAAREEDDSVRNSIALALSSLEDHRASETLWTFFENGSNEVQRAALQGLSRLGDDRVIPIAMSWYASGDRLQRAIGVFDLTILQTAGGEKALAELLAAETNWRGRLLIRRAMRRGRKWRARHG